MEGKHAAAQARQRACAAWSANALQVGALRGDEPVSPPRERVVELARLRAGARVLDLACGRGNAAIIPRIGPSGALLGLDLSDAQVEAARAWASAQDFSNAAFRAIASELDLGVPAASFDAAICTFGLMYMPDPVAALRALRAALRPGGRVALTTWGRCPFFAVPLAIIGRHVGGPAWDPTEPGPFALRDQATLARIMGAAGFVAVETEAMTVPVGPTTPAAFWDWATGEAVGPWRCWPAAAEPARAAIRADALATLAAMFPAGPVQLTGEVLIAAGDNPR